MNIQLNDTVDQIVTGNLTAARVLTRSGIDLCSDGRKSLKTVCAEANISYARLRRQIRRAELCRAARLADVRSVGLDELTVFMERHDHFHIYEDILFIKSNVARLLRLYGKRHPELEEINQTFMDLTAHLTVHMGHEEHILFPYIRKMAKCGKRIRSGKFKSVGSPIALMAADHEAEHETLRKLNDLTHHYSPPCEQASIFQVTYQALAQFERDVRAHIRLENEVLFPKAMQMEAHVAMASGWKN